VSRRRRELGLLATERWPLLTNMMVCYFNQDFGLLYGSLGEAVAAAAADGSTDYRRSLLGEWRDWNSSQGAVNDIRPFLEYGFRVAVLFKTAVEARHFMNRIYDELLVSVKAETQGSREK
jgi:hypothetical protein